MMNLRHLVCTDLLFVETVPPALKWGPMKISMTLINNRKSAIQFRGYLLLLTKQATEQLLPMPGFGITT